MENVNSNIAAVSGFETSHRTSLVINQSVMIFLRFWEQKRQVLRNCVVFGSVSSNTNRRDSNHYDGLEPFHAKLDVCGVHWMFNQYRPKSNGYIETVNKAFTD